MKHLQRFFNSFPPKIALQQRKFSDTVNYVFIPFESPAKIKLSLSINISPSSFGCNPAIDLNSVVFPVPLPPVNEMNWPDDRVKFKPSKRLTPPRETLKFSTDSNMHNT